LLALSLTFAMVASVQAQDRHDQRPSGTTATLQVNFGTAPHWSGVRGTHVQMMRQTERPKYDMFRYGRTYYAYNNNQWYRSNRMNGGYVYMNDRDVPREVSRVPRAHWQNYPSGWNDRNSDPRSGRNGQHYPGGSGH
jgi:hypothetical protein